MDQIQPTEDRSSWWPIMKKIL